MAATPETLALAALVILYLLLTAAELFLHIRRSQQRRRRRQQLQQVLPPPPTVPAAHLATPTAPDPEGEEKPADESWGEKQTQRRRRRARRKRQQQGDGEGAGGGDAASPSAETASGKGEPLLPRRPQFPLASVAGALQRRINERYDDLARASEAQCLTIEQVNEFINCLIEARNELLQRYENVERSFKIKKAMLSNHRNYRSSYDRLFEQVCRLETERNNLKKDAAIYNSLQERLQESVPYKMIMELDATAMEDSEISFEELLAQEKEDTAFWQRNGKMRSISSKVGK